MKRKAAAEAAAAAKAQQQQENLKAFASGLTVAPVISTGEIRLPVERLTKSQREKHDWTVASEQLKEVCPTLFQQGYPSNITHQQIQVLEAIRKDRTRVLLLPHDKLKDFVLKQYQDLGVHPIITACLTAQANQNNQQANQNNQQAIQNNQQVIQNNQQVIQGNQRT
ncbi:MAG: hypothetical protein Q9221_001335 [Calogaya cf. arnoldii]